MTLLDIPGLWIFCPQFTDRGKPEFLTLMGSVEADDRKKDESRRSRAKADNLWVIVDDLWTKAYNL